VVLWKIRCANLRTNVGDRSEPNGPSGGGTGRRNGIANAIGGCADKALHNRSIGREQYQIAG
jgi:hypothetical protein